MRVSRMPSNVGYYGPREHAGMKNFLETRIPRRESIEFLRAIAEYGRSAIYLTTNPDDISVKHRRPVLARKTVFEQCGETTAYSILRRGRRTD